MLLHISSIKPHSAMEAQQLADGLDKITDKPQYIAIGPIVSKPLNHMFFTKLFQ